MRPGQQAEGCLEVGVEESGTKRKKNGSSWPSLMKRRGREVCLQRKGETTTTKKTIESKKTKARKIERQKGTTQTNHSSLAPSAYVMRITKKTGACFVLVFVFRFVFLSVRDREVACALLLTLQAEKKRGNKKGFTRQAQADREREGQGGIAEEGGGREMVKQAPK